MTRLAVIGLDGASYPYLARYRAQLGTFMRLMFNQRVWHGPLWCDVRPMHSGPCWAQMFAGQTFGLTDFARGKDAARILAHDGWLWSGLGDEAVVVGVPVTLSPISVNMGDRGWLETTLALTLDEMRESVWRRTCETLTALRRARTALVVSVWPALDRAGHTFGMEDPRTLAIYREVDDGLAKLWPTLDGWTWAIVSDHGMHGTERARDPAWGDEPVDRRRGWHAPEGIVISNVPNVPSRLTNVHAWLEQAIYGGKRPDG